jgi:uncharacterized protein involved in type VI secretion and phage assembly
MPATAERRFLGKYRASVVVNVDPQRLGRLTLRIPDVLGDTPSTWALPCFPAAGRQMGVFALPPVGAAVWAEFEHGDPDYPIWTGGWWGSASEVPSLALTAPPGMQNILLQTTGQNLVLLTDTPGPTGGIVLRSKGGASITVNDTGIYLSNGQGAEISLVGSTVSVNKTALTVS